MKRALLIATVLGAGLGLSTPAAPLTQEETGEIETVIRDYLLRNPEVLLEAMQVLETRRAEEAEAAQRAAIASAGEELFASPAGTVLGNPEGDVTIVEFFDYNCGFCKRALADKSALLSADPNLRFVLKEIPVLGPPSEAATKVSLAVRKVAPDQYGEFHTRLLGSRGVADEARAFAVADEIGLAESEVRDAMDDPDVVSAAEESTRLAGMLRIDGTPSYVVGDEVIPGAVGADVLAAKIANVRACGSTSC